MRKTYIDITQLVHWGGNLTGIPRVMNELSLRYAKQPDTVFLVWNKAANCFYELDIDKSLTKRGHGIFYKTETSLKAKEGHDVEYGVSAREHFFMLVKKAAKKLERHNPEVYKKVSARLNSAVQIRPGSVVQPTPRDTLIVLWGEWGDEKYRATITTVKGHGTTLVQVVYDMLPVLAPQYSGHSTQAMYDHYTQTMPISDLVLSISESTKNDLTKWLRDQNLKVPKIEVFRLGDDFALSKPIKPSQSSFIDGMGSEKNYILCVGTVEARKNHTLLYYVYKLARERGIQLPKMVIAGRRGWRSDDIFEIITSDPEVKDDIIFVQNTSDEELSWLYRNCMFTVYPSFYEGWGIPIAESIAYGKPSISSNTSSMPEVAKGLIDYFSPLSTDECLAALVKLLSKTEFEKAKSRISNYQITSWDDTYHQVNNAIMDVYGTKN